MNQVLPEKRPFWRWLAPISSHWIALAIGVWLLAMAGGFALLLREENRAGEPATAPRTWPVASRIAHRDDRFTLLVFAHPQCACTRATLRDLERVLARARGNVTTYVVFALPAGAPDNWRRSALTQAARGISGVTVLMDPDELEARRFGARTSGQALLYGGDGRLRFAGGLTLGRAHEGDNAGSDAIVAQLAGSAPTPPSTAVFGCALADRTCPEKAR